MLQGILRQTIVLRMMQKSYVRQMVGSYWSCAFADCGMTAASPRLGRAVERGSRKWNEAAFRNLFRHAGIV